MWETLYAAQDGPLPTPARVIWSTVSVVLRQRKPMFKYVTDVISGAGRSRPAQLDR